MRGQIGKNLVNALLLSACDGGYWRIGGVIWSDLDFSEVIWFFWQEAFGFIQVSRNHSLYDGGSRDDEN